MPFLKKLTTLEAAMIVLMAALGVALKPVVGPLARLVASALFLPAGALAGAVYMMWPMLALFTVRRFGTASLVGLLEGVVVLITGLYGSHGILSLLIYVAPCLVMDLGWLAVRASQTRWPYFLPAGLGNAAGSLLVGFLIMRMPTVPLLVSLIPAFLFGGLGGWLAFGLYRMLLRSFPYWGRGQK